MNYTALSVHQPYANLIASGRKTLEIRSWKTKHRGPLLICSAKRPAVEPPLGVAVCLVDLVDVRPFEPGEIAAACLDRHYEGHYAWVFQNPREVEHFPVKGQQRLFSVGYKAL